MKKWEFFIAKHPKLYEHGSFILKTCFYFTILLFLIYLYHYRQIDGGSFIYNEF